MNRKDTIKKYLIITTLIVAIAFYVFYNSEYAVRIESENIEEVTVSNIKIRNFQHFKTPRLMADKYYIYLTSNNTTSKINSVSLVAAHEVGDTIEAKVQKIKKLGFIEKERIVPIFDDNNFIKTY